MVIYVNVKLVGCKAVGDGVVNALGVAFSVKNLGGVKCFVGNLGDDEDAIGEAVPRGGGVSAVGGEPNPAGHLERSAKCGEALS